MQFGSREREEGIGRTSGLTSSSSLTIGPTMNLEAFTMNTSDREFRRVVRHEAGHTLGFPHEHMRRALVAKIDKNKAYDYFRRTQGWDKQTVDQQVLTPLSETSIMGTPEDQDSIMCYQLPGDITRDGKPIRGGLDINPTDASYAAKIYPKSAGAPKRQRDGGEREESYEQQDWDELWTLQWPRCFPADIVNSAQMARRLNDSGGEVMVEPKVLQ